MKQAIALLFFIFSGAEYLPAQGIVNTGPAVSPLVLNAGYRCPLNSGAVINSGHGFYFEAGFNPAYYLKHPQLIAVIAGVGTKDRLWATHFSRNFIRDFNASVQDVMLPQADSLVLSLFKEAVNRRNSKTFEGCYAGSFHNSSFCFGLLVRLPFKKYNPCIKLYKGLVQSSCTVNDPSGYSSGYNYFAVRRKMWGAELILFNGFARELREKFGKIPLLAHIGVVSIYYERNDFYGSRLYFSDGDRERTIAFADFLPSSIMEKYRNENVFGIRLSAGIY
jgi:hypothetical protein